MTNEELVNNYQNSHNESFLIELFERNRGLVKQALKRLTGNGYFFSAEDYQDFIQSARIGIWRAAETFEPEKKFQFSTHCYWQIWGAVTVYFVRRRFPLSGLVGRCSKRKGYKFLPLELPKVYSRAKLLPAL